MIGNNIYRRQTHSQCPQQTVYQVKNTQRFYQQFDDQTEFEIDSQFNVVSIPSKLSINTSKAWENTQYIFNNTSKYRDMNYKDQQSEQEQTNCTVLMNGDLKNMVEQDCGSRFKYNESKHIMCKYNGPLGFVNIDRYGGKKENYAKNINRLESIQDQDNYQVQFPQDEYVKQNRKTFQKYYLQAQNYKNQDLNAKQHQQIKSFYETNYEINIQENNYDNQNKRLLKCQSMETRASQRNAKRKSQRKNFFFKNSNQEQKEVIDDQIIDLHKFNLNFNLPSEFTRKSQFFNVPIPQQKSQIYRPSDKICLTPQKTPKKGSKKRQVSPPNFLKNKMSSKGRQQQFNTSLENQTKQQNQLNTLISLFGECRIKGLNIKNIEQKAKQNRYKNKKEEFFKLRYC